MNATLDLKELMENHTRDLDDRLHRAKEEFLRTGKMPEFSTDYHLKEERMRYLNYQYWRGLDGPRPSLLELVGHCKCLCTWPTRVFTP